MPGFDGTGPQGMGPMTGGARGYCAGGVPGPYGYGRRYGGIAPGFRGRQFGAFQGYGYAPEAELQFLQQQVSFWRQNIEQVEARIKQLTEQMQKEQPVGKE